MGIRDEYKKMCDAPCGDCAMLTTCVALDCARFKSWVSEQGWQKKVRVQCREDDALQLKEEV